MSVTAIVCSDAKTKLLSRAEELFAEHGYELTSTRHIASAAGMNLALISYYFGSKQALYREIFVSRLEEMSLSLKSIAWHPLSATDKLTKFIMIYIDRYRSNSKFQRMLYREILFLNKSQIKDVIDNYLGENTGVFQEIMAEGVASGDFKTLNTSFFYMTLISMMSMIICDAPVAGKLPGQVYSEEEIKSYLYHILLTKNNTINSMN
jgi:AcrR family transcriptional regulator